MYEYSLEQLQEQYREALSHITMDTDIWGRLFNSTGEVDNK